ncbi:MAG: sialate O-acetylesterase [Verrucomicrobiota bacterium]
MKIPVFILTLLISLIGSGLTRAEIRLPALIGDHMVLQRDLKLPIWGWAEPGETIRVSIADQAVSAEAGDDGRWEVTLEPIAGTPFALTMTIAGTEETIVLSNIVVGEVWVCSGQSNMQWSVAQSYNPDLESLTANYPNIRLITVPRIGTQELQDDFEGQWELCTPKTVTEFSAVGYYFGRQLHQTLGVPIGLIDNAWGGSAAEAWVPREVMERDERFQLVMDDWRTREANWDYEAMLAKWQEQADKAKGEGKRLPRRPQNVMEGQHRPGNLWAGVLNPVIGYGIRGTIWYQGESNSTRAWQYDDLFGLMITEWRKAWGQGDFPFYWVQLADFRDEEPEPIESDWAELREAQSNVLALPNTGQAVIYDIGEGRDIHPRDKQNVALRLARLALAKDYGIPLAHLSPSFDSMAVEGDVARLTFKDVGSRLYSFDTPEVTGFAVAGEDRVWHWATGKVEGENQVLVSSPDEPNPVAVRYAWANNPVANLFSREGLPVVPFRTDDWPQITDPANATPAE